MYRRGVYTDRVDARPVVWDAANRKHLAQDHPERGISVDEIAEVLADGRRVEVYLENRDAFQVIGRTATGRWLVVIWITSRRAGIQSTRVKRQDESFGGSANEDETDT